MSNRKAAVLIGLSMVMTISLSAAANADPVLLGTTTNPTGINDLVVDSTTYDVTFSLTTLNTFTQGSTLSKDAVSALAAVLNSGSVSGLGNFSATLAYILDVDSSLSNFDVLACGVPGCVGHWGIGPAIVLNNLGSNQNGAFYAQAAVFTAVGTPTTPLPATLPLFATGLGALGLLGWRRKRKAQG